MSSELQLDVRRLSRWRRHQVNAYEVKAAGMVCIAGKTVWSMPERFKVVCIPCKALYKCSAFLPLIKTSTRIDDKSLGGKDWRLTPDVLTLLDPPTPLDLPTTPDLPTLLGYRRSRRHICKFCHGEVTRNWSQCNLALTPLRTFRNVLSAWFTLTLMVTMKLH